MFAGEFSMEDSLAPCSWALECVALYPMSGASGYFLPGEFVINQVAVKILCYESTR